MRKEGKNCGSASDDQGSWKMATVSELWKFTG
jgi:hypothetical protein